MIRLPTPSAPSAGQVLTTVVLVAAVSPFAVFAVPQTIGADEGFVVLSGSMEPALSPGDVVIVDASATVGTGDVITYRTTGDSVPTTHRVVGTVDDGYQTKGDANEDADAGVVGPEAVVGRVVLTIPLVGHVILWANTPLGYVTLVVGPLVLLGASELLAWARREPTGADPEPPTSEQAESPSDPDAADSDATADDRESSEMRSSTSDPESQPARAAVAAVDLRLTLVATGALVTYAGWNVYREFVRTTAPDPVSVAALTAGLLGLLFAGSVTVTAWRAARARSGPSPAGPGSAPTLTDGSGDAEAEDE